MGNRVSRDVSVLTNDGEGQLELTQRINVNLPIADMYFADLTRDIYSDLVVASPAGEYIAFLENEAGEGFVVRDIIASQVPLRCTAIRRQRGWSQRYCSAVLCRRADADLHKRRRAFGRSPASANRCGSPRSGA